MTRLVPLFVFLGLALLLGIALLSQTAPKADTSGGQKVPLPPLTLAPLMSEDAPWDQSHLNAQVTLINFFASWCTPCLAENPELLKLKKQFPGLRIEGIVWNDSEATMKHWLQKNGNPYHALWLDAKGNSAISLGIRGIPESFLIDAQGNARYHITGPLTQGERNGELGDLITTLLKENHAR